MSNMEYENRKNSIEEFVEQHHQETRELLKTLAVIPAPLGRERERAAFILDWLHRQGAGDAVLDGAGNVVYPYQCEEGKKFTVVMAHMDVVCPDTEKLPLSEEADRLTAPGVRDDTANLVNMMMAVKYLLVNHITLPSGILFAADVGEEGLGNLRGGRQIYETYGRQIKEWICFDLNYDVLYTRAVGSRRYRITARTKGGHSYNDFGEENAIVCLAELIVDLYHAKTFADAKVTYNVGRIEGGTAVNAIAQEAFILYEFRSESEKALCEMEKFLQKTLRTHRKTGVDISAEILGIRPGNGTIDSRQQNRLEQRCLASIRTYYSGKVCCCAGSTDGNIPLSKGIPSVTLGTAMGGGTHTRQEWVDTESMKTGQKIALDVILGVR